MTSTGPKGWIALAAGGTGGHMFPAQAVAQELKRRDWQILLLTDARGMRYGDGFPADEIITLSAANPNVRGLSAKVSMARAMATGVRQARQALRRLKPRMVIGFGGYPSAPGLFAARSLGLPYGVHEQNAVLGRVNRRAAPRARFVAHGFSQLERLPQIKGQLVQTGNPVRDKVRAIADRPYPAIEKGGPLHILIFGGSQGASLFGRVFAPALASFPKEMKDRLRITHQVSDADHARVASIYEAAGLHVELAPFFTDLPDRMANAHFVISRAGASTVSELAVIGRPSLLVPLGIAMDDHQRGNAQVLVKAGAADLLLEADATPERATALLLPRLSGEEDLALRAAAAKGQVPIDAAGRLANVMETNLV
ncbi:MAG: UDP-N-acetylglucosamine--N-acetylmuramyl-(pentapeptide) pyrophosphoryl-undecaprenol N-acetylglucosamine transferase [Pseudomonadota bacterium]